MLHRSSGKAGYGKYEKGVEDNLINGLPGKSKTHHIIAEVKPSGEIWKLSYIENSKTDAYPVEIRETMQHIATAQPRGALLVFISSPTSPPTIKFWNYSPESHDSTLIVVTLNLKLSKVFQPVHIVEISSLSEV